MVFVRHMFAGLVTSAVLTDAIVAPASSIPYGIFEFQGGLTFNAHQAEMRVYGATEEFELPDSSNLNFLALPEVKENNGCFLRDGEDSIGLCVKDHAATARIYSYEPNVVDIIVRDTIPGINYGFGKTLFSSHQGSTFQIGCFDVPYTIDSGGTITWEYGSDTCFGKLNEMFGEDTAPTKSYLKDGIIRFGFNFTAGDPWAGDPSPFTGDPLDSALQDPRKGDPSFCTYNRIYDNNPYFKMQHCAPYEQVELDLVRLLPSKQRNGAEPESNQRRLVAPATDFTTSCADLERFHAAESCSDNLCPSTPKKTRRLTSDSASRFIPYGMYEYTGRADFETVTATVNLNYTFRIYSSKPNLLDVNMGTPPRLYWDEEEEEDELEGQVTSGMYCVDQPYTVDANNVIKMAEINTTGNCVGALMREMFGEDASLQMAIKGSGVDVSMGFWDDDLKKMSSIASDAVSMPTSISDQTCANTIQMYNTKCPCLVDEAATCAELRTAYKVGDGTVGCCNASGSRPASVNDVDTTCGLIKNQYNDQLITPAGVIVRNLNGWTCCAKKRRQMLGLDPKKGRD